ncbi:MAG: cytochrome c oxidase cbb3-type subunit I/II [Verrucomicrobiales bacterium]|jgi:cytochrome c oxidase cbb3-type subunit I/II
MQTEKVTIEFEDKSVRMFLIATVIWAIVAMLVGVLVASQLNFWEMNGKFIQWITFGAFKTEGIEFLSFGRLRPLHTNAAIFAFVGNMIFAGVYYSTQRLCKCRTASDLLTMIHFWGWQLIIVSAAVTLPAGFTRGKEYAELIWPINIAVALIWVVFAINFFWTLKKRNEPSLYVALWFYIGTIITVAMLYIVNHLQIPTSLTHAYPIFGGVQDALVQWWYGHNAVAFFLTTPILGIMYYFLPKAAGRPVYSYRLSIIHFWSLVFIYIWAGPHHLLNTSLPQWLQMLGMFFSLMLWAPSWGGMLNGLLTLRGAWDKLRTDPVIKFFVVGITFYGMCTFEGPLLAIRAVNSLSHYSDWTIGHVHSGTLGWNGFMAAGMIYWLAPRLWGTKLHSIPLANMHFWLGLVGILLYVSSMWVSGIMQGLMLNETKEAGTMLANPDFVKTLNAIRPMMLARLFGGFLYLAGFILLAYNFFRTIASGKPVTETREVALLNKKEADADQMGLIEMLRSEPVLYTLIGCVLLILWFFLPPYANVASLVAAIVLVVMAIAAFRRTKGGWGAWYDRLLENWMPFSVLAFVAVAIGGAVQIIPTITVNSAKNVEERLQVPYTPLELAGRDIYVSEGCYNCHSQMIRTMVPDVLRYGAKDGYSRLGESTYDHPHQWGSKRTGPDLAREGTNDPRSNSWHFRHLVDPRQVTEGSNMPSYPWLVEQKADLKALPKKLKVQAMLGVPYKPMRKDEIQALAIEQGMVISKDLKTFGIYVEPDAKIVAVISYLQKLGTFEQLDKEGDPVPVQDLKPGVPDSLRPTANPKP